MDGVRTGLRERIVEHVLIGVIAGLTHVVVSLVLHAFGVM